MRCRRGVTLVETVVASAIVALVIVAAGNGLLTGRKAAEKGLSHLDRLGQMNRLLEHCKRALRYARQIDSTTDAPGTACHEVIYVQAVVPPGLTPVENTMVIRSRKRQSPDGTAKTTVVVEHDCRRFAYVLENVDFTLVRQGRLATVTLAPTAEPRPPVILCVAAPLLAPPAPGIVVAKALK